jgi:PTH2 family peptidyl-tRNA hydrolase
MRKGKIAAQAAHASLKVLLDLAWSADMIRPTLNSPRLEEKGASKPGGATISGDFRCIPLWPTIKPWVDGNFAKIVVGVNSEAELIEIHERAKEAGILTSLIRDAGLTEFNGVPTLTTCAVGPDLNEKVDTITAKLELL